MLAISCRRLICERTERSRISSREPTGKAWLFKILYSVFINKYRKSQREPQVVPLEEEFHRLATADSRVGYSPPGNGTSLEASSPQVNQALENLPEVFRSTVLLIDVEELTYQEAAEVLQCPLGTVRSRLFRARRMLFVALQEYAQRAGYVEPFG